MTINRISFFLALLGAICVPVFSASATPNTVKFKQSSYTAAEDSGSVTLTVIATRMGDAAEIIKVAYTTMDGTAQSPDDYIAKSGTVEFGPGVIEQTIT